MHAIDNNKDSVIQVLAIAATLCARCSRQHAGRNGHHGRGPPAIECST
jgi:hypothetical protein